MTERNVSKKTRFEVFKRDGFTCQYCGRSAPDVVLECDHINPISKEGDNDILNLITSCFDCNRGKGDRELSDDSMIKKQQEQLNELNEKRNQLEMMLEWKQELLSLNNSMIEEISNLISATSNHSLSDHGKTIIKKQIRKYGFDEVYESTVIAIEAYYKDGDTSSMGIAINKIGGICYNRKLKKENPIASKASYLATIADKRLSYCKKWSLVKYFKENIADDNYQDFLDIVCNSRNWSHLCAELLEYSGSDPDEY